MKAISLIFSGWWKIWVKYNTVICLKHTQKRVSTIRYINFFFLKEFMRFLTSDSYGLPLESE
jgi:hypothetical protein